MDRRMARRARAIARQRQVVPWWAWALVACGVVAGMPSWGQGTVQPTSPSAVPEVVRPRSDTGTIPPGNDGGVSRPRSENPLAGGDTVRPVPDNGVITPPATGGGAVIRPPVSGVMPIIPPPGSAGGVGGVVPK